MGRLQAQSIVVATNTLWWPWHALPSPCVTAGCPRGCPGSGSVSGLEEAVVAPGVCQKGLQTLTLGKGWDLFVIRLPIWKRSRLWLPAGCWGQGCEAGLAACLQPWDRRH